MHVEIRIEFNGNVLILPVNPEKITPSRSATNDNIDLIGIGPATRKGHPGLRSFTIESFFPGPKSYYFRSFPHSTIYNPADCIRFINEIWETENINNNVARIVVAGIPNPIDWYFVIESFDYDHAAGQESDIPFILSIKEYKEYGAKLMSEDEIASYFSSGRSRVTSTDIAMANTSTNAQYTYTVQSGDCLYNITKACCGDPNKWGELYELNKDIIGKNPGMIKPGQTLKLPDGWNIPTNVAKLKNSVKKSKTNVTSAFGGGNAINAALTNKLNGTSYDSLYEVEKTVTTYGDKPGVYYWKDAGNGFEELVDMNERTAGDTIIKDKTKVTKNIVLPQKRSGGGASSGF